MSNDGTGYVYIGIRAPLVMREWLQRRARIEITDASTVVRRLIRNYMRQVDADAYKEMEALMIGEEDGKEATDA